MNSESSSTIGSTTSATVNSTVACPSSQPSLKDYLSVLPTDYVIVYSVLAFVTFVILLVYVEELHFLYVHSSRQQQRHKAKWLLAVYPVVSLSSFVALLAPRSSGLNDLVAAIFISICVYIFVVMVVESYGGPEIMFANLLGSHLHPFSIPPFCVCCRCVPTVHITRTTVQVLHSMILQFVLVRPFLGYIVAIMWIDESYSHYYGDTNSSIPALLGYISTFSTLMAIWSFAMVYQLSSVPLAHLYILPKFISLQMVLLLTGVQRSVIGIFIVTGHLPCEPPLTSSGVADRWNHMLLICEMFLLSQLARKFYRSSLQKRTDLDRVEGQYDVISNHGSTQNIIAA